MKLLPFPDAYVRYLAQERIGARERLSISLELHLSVFIEFQVTLHTVFERRFEPIAAKPAYRAVAVVEVETRD